MSGDAKPLGGGGGGGVWLGLERYGDAAGVLTQSVRQWWSRTTEVATKNSESRLGERTRVASVVANASREGGSRMGVANGGRERESRKWVVNVGLENKKIMGRM